MSKIKRIAISGYLGLKEFGLDTEKINIFKGPKGSGKSSILEGLETVFTNSKRRTEIIRHDENEATLYVELDDGLEINRKIRNGKADYLKVRKGNEGVPSTEKFLRQLINGDIFRPIDWVNMDSKEQTKSILNMLQISWTQQDIEKWFGEIPSNVDFNQHILMVLKAIETKYFKDRTEINRQIDELKMQMSVIKKDLPTDYDGEVWRDKKVQDYYNKVNEAQEINHYIEMAKSLKENYDNSLKIFEVESENDKSRVAMEYRDKRQDIKDIIDLSNSKIEKALNGLNNSEINLEKALKENGNLYQLSINELDKEYESKKQALKDKLQKRNETTRIEIKKSKEELTDIVTLQNNKIAAKQQELISLNELETQAIEKVEIKKVSDIEAENIRIGKASQYLKENIKVEIEPLQVEADNVSTMREYIRQWDSMIDIRDNKLAEKERESQLLTVRIETARTLPQELLKTAKMPIDGISVDEKGLIRINNTLIDGLSDGEKLELAFKIAKAQCGDLKVICLDRFESLKSDQQKILETAMNDEYQYFITEHTDDTEMIIEKLGGNN